MKRLVFTYILLLIVTKAFPQWEFNYFVVKAGITNQFVNPEPSSVNGLYLNTYEGNLSLIPDTSFNLQYNHGYNFGLDFHFDWQNDMGGFIIGAEYMEYAFTNRFVTPGYDYYLLRTFRMHSVSFPVFIKFGYEIFNLQRYAFAGVRFNWNFAMTISEEVSWTAVIKRQSAPDEFFNRYNYVLMGGINFLFFNIEVDYLPGSFLNKNYQINAGTAEDPYYIKPFEGYPDSWIWINSTIYIPLSPWSSTRSYFLNNLLKLFK